MARSNVTTTESFDMSGPSGHTLDDVKLGSVLTIYWTLPDTFAIHRITVWATFFNANGRRTDLESNEDLVSTSTSATIDMLSQVDGQPISHGWVRVNIIGVKGENTATDWRFQ